MCFFAGWQPALRFWFLREQRQRGTAQFFIELLFEGSGATMARFNLTWLLAGRDVNEFLRP